MRQGNIMVTFEIPCAYDKPDLNGTIYTKDALEKAYKDVKNVPIGIYDDAENFVPIGVAQDVELVEDNGLLRIKGVGIIFHGGTNESVEMTSGIVTGLNISAIGFTTE